MIGFFRDFFGVLNIPCRDLTALLSRRLDGPLPRGTEMGLRLHTLTCGGCSRFYKQLRRLREIARQLGREIDGGEPLPQGVRERVLRSAAEEIKKN